MNINILNNDMIAAMKAKDNVTRDVLRSIIANIKKAAIDERCEITDELCDKVITKELKTVNEMIDTCPADRAETLAIYNAKKAVVAKYAPTIIDNEDEILSYSPSFSMPALYAEIAGGKVKYINYDEKFVFK